MNIISGISEPNCNENYDTLGGSSHAPKQMCSKFRGKLDRRSSILFLPQILDRMKFSLNFRSKVRCLGRKNLLMFLRSCQPQGPRIIHIECIQETPLKSDGWRCPDHTRPSVRISNAPHRPLQQADTYGAVVVI